MSDEKQRIQKLLAHAGIGSRREIERYIEAGVIRVNGRVATLGDKISVTDKVQFNGRIIKLAKKLEQPTQVLMYHKPEGQICSRKDPDHADTVFKHLPRLAQGRWISVGRLDLNSAGLLLFTNDGELANLLMHPAQSVLRVYQVRVRGELTPEERKTLQTGVTLEDGHAAFESIHPVGGTTQNKWYKVGLREGRNREVRRMFEALGHQVSRLIRIQYGPITLPKSLKQGAYLNLTESQIDALKAAC